jgi:hypothetical protein
VSLGHRRKRIHGDIHGALVRVMMSFSDGDLDREVPDALISPCKPAGYVSMSSLTGYFSVPLVIFFIFGLQKVGQTLRCVLC